MRDGDYLRAPAAAVPCGDAGGGPLLRQHGAAAPAAPAAPARPVGGDATALRRRHLGAGVPRDGRRPGRDARPVRARGGVPAARRARPRARRIPLGEPAQHPAVRRLPRVRVQAVAGPRRPGPLPRAVRVGRPGARGTLRPGAVAGARAGLGAGLDPLRGVARAAPRRGARPAASAGRGRGVVALDRRRLTAEILVAGAGPAGLALALQVHAHGAAVRIIDRRPEAARPSRALILHARTLEVLRPLAVTQAPLATADTTPAADLRLGSR